MAGIYRKYKCISTEQFLAATNKELIESYIPLALSIAKRFPPKYISREDAIGIGLLELTRCVMEGERYSQAEFTAYIKKSVFKRIKNHCLRYYGQSVVRSKDLKDEPAISRSMEQEDDICGKNIDLNVIDFKDFINVIITKPLERIIVERLILEGGYGVNDIADEIGVTHQYISKVKNELFERLQKHLCVLQK
jgi:RNA polymerase sigma factor (sigma-70 family)